MSDYRYNVDMVALVLLIAAVVVFFVARMRNLDDPFLDECHRRFGYARSRSDTVQVANMKRGLLSQSTCWDALP